MVERVDFEAVQGSGGRVHPPRSAEKETRNRRRTRAEVAESIHSRGPEAKLEPPARPKG